MNEWLTRGLHAIADRVPPAAVPEDLFNQARSRHRRRTVRGGIALTGVLLVIAVSLVRPIWQQPSVFGAGGPQAGIPTEVVVPPHWCATVGQSSPGPAAAIFGGEATRDDWFEGRFAAVSATGDRYRVIDEMPYRPPGFEALLSPDGRYVAHGRAVTALTKDGKDISYLPGDVIAFSPRSDRLVFATEAELTHPNTYTTPIVGIYDLASRSTVTQVDVGSAWISPGWTAAMSADGRRLALQVRDEIWITRLEGTVGTPYLKIRVPGGRLAGPGSWLPDGRSLMVAEPASDGGWRLSERDTQTGEPVERPALPVPPAATFLRVIAWHSADSAVVLAGFSHGDVKPASDNYDVSLGPFRSSTTDQVRLVVLTRGAASARTVLETPEGVDDLDVAADLATAEAFRSPGEPTFGPPHTLYLIGGSLILAAVTIAIFVAVRAVRNRGRRKAAAASNRG
ncbi:hypothetical protein [Asanoa siamensis]|uniref:WD40-like Beta Propeller Repeat n=1 Tax=Asanoa siamensis TaxID=926357 RepID=A0ABQ4D0G9_9ACTN|nr:hypothetical protein [Asanoa siamensis]GIF77039.1 hypothetical protein Asi02nite_65570 [Asanoa siamensis]